MKIITCSIVLVTGVLAYEFVQGLRYKNLSQAGKDRALRDDLAEGQIDKMLKDTFPASDPLSNY